MPERIPQSVAKRVAFRAYLASDHVTLATGKTIAITISKNGGAFGNPAAGATNATEISSGFYYFDLGTGDSGTAGPLAWRGAVATIDDAGDAYEVVSAFNAGFTGVPAVIASAIGGLLTAPTTANVGLADLSRILGTALTETAGLIAAGFKKFFNVATPTGTVNSLADAVPGAAGGGFIAGTNAATTVTTSFTTTFTGNLTGSVASLTTNNDKTGYVLSATGSAALTEGYAADGAAVTLNQAIYMMLSFMFEKNLSGTTLTTKKLDGSTTAMTLTVDSATAPTTITRAT